MIELELLIGVYKKIYVCTTKQYDNGRIRYCVVGANKEEEVNNHAYRQ